MADDGLDGGSPFHLTFDLRRHAAFLARGEDAELVAGWGIVAAISGVGDQALDRVADQLLDSWNDLVQGMPKSDPIFSDTVSTTMTAAKEVDDERIKAEADSWQ